MKFLVRCLFLPGLIFLQSCSQQSEDARVAQLNDEIKMLRDEIKSLKAPKRPKVMNPVIISKKNKGKKAPETSIPLTQSDTVAYRNTNNTNPFTRPEDLTI